MICRQSAMSLSYTTDDDGVHLDCECGWGVNLGFGTSPLEALQRACEHTGEKPILLLTDKEVLAT